MRHLIRFWMRLRFAKQLSKADWRTATFPQHPEAACEVEHLRDKLTVEPFDQPRVVKRRDS